MDNVLIIARNSNHIGGDEAISRISVNYSGNCEVIDLNNQSIAVLPVYTEAKKVAAYSITPDGGFGSVEVIESSDKKSTHETFIEWFSGI